MTFTELINQDKPVLIDFYTDWCIPCKKMAPIIQDLKSELGNKIEVVKVDIDKNPKIASKFLVRVVPTFILLQSTKMLWRRTGVVQKDDLIAIINSKKVLI